MHVPGSSAHTWIQSPPPPNNAVFTARTKVLRIIFSFNKINFRFRFYSMESASLYLVCSQLSATSAFGAMSDHQALTSEDFREF